MPIVNVVIQDDDLGEFFNDNMQAFRRTIGKDLGPVTHILMLYWESGKEMDILYLTQPTAPGDTFSFSSFFSRPMSLPEDRGQYHPCEQLSLFATIACCWWDVVFLAMRWHTPRYDFSSSFAAKREGGGSQSQYHPTALLPGPFCRASRLTIVIETSDS